MSTKTNAVRLLEAAGIPFELREYHFDEEQFNAEMVANELGVAPETVFKTLLAQVDMAGHLFALIPANMELDLRALAVASENKKIEMVHQRDLLNLTGYMRGAVTVLGAKRAYPVFIEETVQLWPAVAISAGARGLQIVLAPGDLIQIAAAQLADIAR